MVLGSILNVPGDYSSIQTGINAAVNGDTVLVQAGEYFENISFSGKSILVTSNYISSYNNSDITETIINGSALATVVTFNSGEGNESVLQGFTITNGSSYNGGGIYCSGASPTLKHLLITDNHANFNGGGLIGYFDSHPRLISVTIIDNTANSNGGAVYLWESEIISVNSIFWNNLPQEIYFNDNGAFNSVTISHCNVMGGADDIVTNGNGSIDWQDGNLNIDPGFQDYELSNFQLSNESPCINMGIPLFSYNFEIVIDLDPSEYDGEFPDMGAFEFIAIYGCTDVNAFNYDPFANIDDGSCIFISGCTDETAGNYNPDAYIDDGSCEYAPVISDIEALFIDEDTSLELSLTIIDLDSETIFVSASNDTTAVNVWVDGNVLHAVPEANWNGTTNITVYASDTVYEDIELFTLTVTPVVDEPVMIHPGNQSINENSSLQIILQAIDDDGDFLTFSTESITEELNLFLSVDTLTVVPDPNWYGAASITISVSDGLFTDTVIFELTVMSLFDDIFVNIGELTLDSNKVEIIIDSETDILGFQMMINGDNLVIDHIRGGWVDEFGFIIQFDSETGLLLAFSPLGEFLQAGSGLLFNLYFEGWGNPELCLGDIVFTQSNGNEANVIIGDCLLIEFPIGDMNEDDDIDILDVVTLIEIVLSGGNGDSFQMWAGDLNLDGEINITDIVIMVQIILESV